MKDGKRNVREMDKINVVKYKIWLNIVFFLKYHPCPPSEIFGSLPPRAKRSTHLRFNHYNCLAAITILISRTCNYNSAALPELNIY